MRRALILLLWLFIGGTLLVASVPADSYASALTDQVPKVSITLGQATVQPGDQQQINVQIDEIAEQRTSLILVVTYPSGVIERSLHYVDHGVGTIAWPIPVASGVGETNFRLVVNGCACGEHNTIPQQATVASTVAGTFMISRLQ